MRRRAAGGVARGPEAQGAQAWALDIPPGRRSRKAARLSGEIVRFAVSSLLSLPARPAGFLRSIRRYFCVCQLPIGLDAPGGPGELMS